MGNGDVIISVDEDEESLVDWEKKVEMKQEVDQSVEIVERGKCEVQDDKETDVEGFELVSAGGGTEVNRAMECGEEANDDESKIEKKQQEVVMGLEVTTADEGMAGMEKVEVAIQTGGGDIKLEGRKNENDKLANGCIGIPLNVIARAEEEQFDGVQALPDDDGRIFKRDEAAMDIVETPIKLEAKDSLDRMAVTLEVSELVELAVELEVPDSESDDGFSPLQEVVAEIQKVKSSTQLVRVPAAVDQLRTYLFDRKYLAIAELDGYLFAHKCITDEEANEIGVTIEKIISVAIKLPKRPTIKVALYNLLAAIEQLELTLGNLPEFLRS